MSPLKHYNNDDNDDYFGKDNTKEGYLNFFLTYASDDNITPKSYAEFTLRKIGVDRAPNSVKLTIIQKNDLNYLIENNGTFNNLCNILTPRQLGYVGW